MHDICPTSFGDPGFKWHTTLARTFGLVVLRLADSRIVPMHYGEYAQQLSIYADEVCLGRNGAVLIMTFHGRYIH